MWDVRCESVDFGLRIWRGIERRAVLHFSFFISHLTFLIFHFDETIPDLHFPM